MPGALWSGQAPGVVFGLGAAAGLMVAGLVANLWWWGYQRSRRAMFGFVLGALATALRDVQAERIHHVTGGNDLQRCIDLCASLQRLLDE